jgi:hypothetical protein
MWNTPVQSWGDSRLAVTFLLDYELKRDYQTFLNRPNRENTADDDVTAFADAHGLPIVDGHLELPDLRIEYEAPDGTLQHRDVELVTEHYSRAQLAGKSQAGFSMYRAAGARLGGGSTGNPSSCREGWQRGLPRSSFKTLRYPSSVLVKRAPAPRDVDAAQCGNQIGRMSAPCGIVALQEADRLDAALAAPGPRRSAALHA